MYNKAIHVIGYKVIGRPHVITEPSMEILRAMGLAVHALEKQEKAMERNFSRHIAVLNYHLANPAAMLFKDRYTIDAMTAGINAIKWLMGADKQESVVQE